ncbi:MAG TPA: hypothetical protein DIT50_06930 [Rhodocyclaceae bacterium]|nr:hypothetical protein [Rhodocyclaceae bacterium]
MKTYLETYIRKSETAQLILLQRIYSLSGSQDLIFRGGTALRWCHGGSRFSEDLDFVTPLAPRLVKAKMNRAFKAAEKEMAPHFGVGTLSVSDRSTRQDTLKLFADYQSAAFRGKISIKLEFERILPGCRPDTRNHVLSSLPAVSSLLVAGDFRVPRPNAVLVAETVPEPLSDKVRALLERRYLKGRDIFDVWYLRSALNAAVEKTVIERKFGMYAWPFRAVRRPDFFADPTPQGREEMKAAIVQDLARFLPLEAFAVHRSEGFYSLLNALRSLFAELKNAGVAVP